jgi:hypothetical protein
MYVLVRSSKIFYAVEKKNQNTDEAWTFQKTTCHDPNQSDVVYIDFFAQIPGWRQTANPLKGRID